MTNKKINVLLIPIDNRPVCYDFAISLCSIAQNINLLIPPRELMGSLTSYANTKGLLRWLKSIKEKVDYTICCLDTIAYGGLIASRRIDSSYKEITQNADNFFEAIKEKGSKIYAFSSIMRISDNNINEEEKSYWDKYGKQIFDYSYSLHKTGKEPQHSIPKEILKDYLNTRKRNFEINKYYLQKDFDFLVFSRDDTSTFGLNVQEGEALESLIREKQSNAMVLSGADEIWAGLLSRAYVDFCAQSVSFAPVYNHLCAPQVITRYDGVSIEQTLRSYFKMTNTQENVQGDISLIVNAPFKVQDDLALGIFEDEKKDNYFVFDKSKNYAIADVRYANGADNDFVKNYVLSEKSDSHFFGYSAWNTTANSVGFLLAMAILKFLSQKNNVFCQQNFKTANALRLLDDWAYQANIRQLIRNGDKRDLFELFEPYIEETANFLEIEKPCVNFYFPWNRTFEIGMVLK